MRPNRAQRRARLLEHQSSLCTARASRLPRAELAGAEPHSRQHCVGRLPGNDFDLELGPYQRASRDGIDLKRRSRIAGR